MLFLVLTYVKPKQNIMNTSDLELFATLYFILSVAVAIVFFVMAANINRLKKDIKDLRKIAIRYAKKDNIDLS